jgi:hypothetical protein
MIKYQIRKNIWAFLSEMEGENDVFKSAYSSQKKVLKIKILQGYIVLC